jgi:hypothetical protein
MTKAAIVVALVACWANADAAVAQTNASSGAAPAQSGTSGVVLITNEEAKLPDAIKATMTRRAGVTRGPKILLMQPGPAGASVSSPVHFQIKFESFGGAKIDPASVSVNYLKDPPVDLTQRLQPAIGSAGIDVTAAEIPPGSHDLRVDVKDSDGRSGTGIFTLNVTH